MLDKTIVSFGTIAAVVGVVFLLAGASLPYPGKAASFATKGDLQDLSATQNRLHQETNKRVEQLRQWIQRLDSDINNRPTLDDVRSEFANYATQVELSDVAVALRDDFRTLEERVNDFDRAVEQHGVILSAISRSPADGVFVPNILSNMAKETSFREEMDRAVNNSIRDESHVRITNMTHTVQKITVNETYSRNLAPGERWELFDLPTGNVSTRLAQQRLVNWAVGPPKYSLKLQIVRRGPIVTYFCP